MGKKIAILGTGANGSCTAADLVRNGYDVTLIDQWPAHIEAMRADGLRVKMPDEELHVEVNAHHLCDVATFTGKFDLVFLMTKAYDARWMAELIKPYLADDGLLIGAQNSMTAEDLADIVGRDRTLGCVVELSSECFTPGTVTRNTPPPRTWFGIGALDASMTHRLAEVEEVLGHVGKVSISDDIISAKWMKLIVNVMTMAIRSMMGMTAGEVARIEGVRELMLHAGAEALTAGQALGYKTVPIMGLTKEDAEKSNRFLELMLDKLVADVGGGTRNAMYQDHLKGRRTEIEMLNGFVSEAGLKHGLATPVNDVLISINQQITAGELKPEAANLERALAAIQR
ncbi:MAG: 2-dehydropantoate 2-reductase [Rhizobiales bacterium]|nr:2-dehydropantoate 2-reductase [Hyphomicrobiales bacterium]